MKKILSTFLALSLSVFTLSFAASAEETSAAETGASDTNATFCFDTDASLSDWSNYTGNTDAQISMSISDKIGETGYSLALNSVRKTDAADVFSGTCFTSSSVGLESFDSCKITYSYYIPKEFAEYSDNLSFFTDGIVWTQNDVPTEKCEQWLTYTVTVPENAKNTKAGIYIPVTGKYSGPVAYIDNIKVYNADGKLVANTGDYKDVKITGEKLDLKTNGIFVSILQVVVVVAIIGGIAALAAYFIKKKSTKYR